MRKIYYKFIQRIFIVVDFSVRVYLNLEAAFVFISMILSVFAECIKFFIYSGDNVAVSKGAKKISLFALIFLRLASHPGKTTQIKREKK